MNDLEWIARNINEWPEDIPSKYARVTYINSRPSCVFSTGSNAPTLGIWFTKDQWLAERTRLQNKPMDYIWHSVAQDESGEWWGYAYIPMRIAHGWDKTGHCVRISKGEVLGDWRDTLEKRPEQMTPPTHTNHRCVQVTIENQEWYGEGLPPVGTVCEVRETITQFSEFAKWSECKILAVNIGRQKDKQFIIKDHNGDAAILYEVDGIEFRPLLTDEEKAISKIETMIDEWMQKEGGAEHIAKSIYDYCIKNQDAAE